MITSKHYIQEKQGEDSENINDLKMESIQKEEQIEVTTKNPKRVEAGKRLAEYNFKKREELKTIKEREPQVKQQTTSEFASENMGYGIAALITIATVSGYYFYTRPQKTLVKARNNSNNEKTKPLIDKFTMD